MDKTAKAHSSIFSKVTKWDVLRSSIIIVLIISFSIIYYMWQYWFPWYWQYFVFEFKNGLMGLPLLLPLIFATVFFWWRGAVITWTVSFLILLPRLIYYHPLNWAVIVVNIAVLFLPLAIVITIAFEIDWRRRQRDVMKERDEERQLYMAQILKVQEDERSRIARELHDESTQDLLVLANKTQKLVSDLNNKNIAEEKAQAEQIRDRIVTLSEDLRRISHDLRPGILDNVGLIPAVEWLADLLNQETNMNARLIVHGEAKKLGPEAETQIFRLVQEALNNIRRHAKATEININLEFNTNCFIISVKDNGQGFDLNKTYNDLILKRKLGIVGMQQRAKLINGIFDIQSKPGEGTLVSLSMPL